MACIGHNELCLCLAPYGSHPTHVEQDAFNTSAQPGMQFWQPWLFLCLDRYLEKTWELVQAIDRNATTMTEQENAAWATVWAAAQSERHSINSIAL